MTDPICETAGALTVWMLGFSAEDTELCNLAEAGPVKLNRASRRQVDLQWGVIF